MRLFHRLASPKNTLAEKNNLFRTCYSSSKHTTNMKNLIKTLALALCVVAIFTNCQNNPTPAGEATAADSTAINEPVVEGYWVNKGWWETLNSTKSPRKAAEKLGVAAVVVQKDSTGAWEAVVNYAFHEGGTYKLQPAEGGNFALMNAEGGDAAHQFLFNADNTVYLDSFQMTRLGDGQMDDTDMFSGIVSGAYTLNGKPGGDVSFYSNGTVSGLTGYETYEVLFDYIEDAVGADELMLIKPGGEERDFYIFEIKDNKLLLSTVDEITNKDGSGVFKKGKVKYDLTKK